MTEPDIDDIARLMGLRLTRLLMATDEYDPHHITPSRHPTSSDRRFHPDVITKQINDIINPDNTNG